MGTQIDGADRIEHVTHHGNAVERVLEEEKQPNSQARSKQQQQQRPQDHSSYNNNMCFLIRLQIF